MTQQEGNIPSRRAEIATTRREGLEPSSPVSWFCGGVVEGNGGE